MQGKKKLVAAAALTASLTAGGVVGAMFGAPTISSAQTTPDQSVERAERPAGSRSGDVQPADRAGRAGEGRSMEDGGHEGRPGHHRRGLALEAAAEALGMTAEELKSEMRNGKSIRAVAEERGLEVQTVIDAIVAAVTEHAEERATAFVNRELPPTEERAGN